MISSFSVRHAVPKKPKPKGHDNCSEEAIMFQDTNTTGGARREDRHPMHDTGRMPVLGAGTGGPRTVRPPGLQHPVLTQLARGRVGDRGRLPLGCPSATPPTSARELLAERYVRPDPEGAVAVTPELKAAHTRPW